MLALIWCTFTPYVTGSPIFLEFDHGRRRRERGSREQKRWTMSIYLGRATCVLSAVKVHGRRGGTIEVVQEHGSAHVQLHNDAPATPTAESVQTEACIQPATNTSNASYISYSKTMIICTAIDMARLLTLSLVFTLDNTRPPCRHFPVDFPLWDGHCQASF